MTNKLPKLSELDKNYREFIFAVLRAMDKPETESEFHRQIIRGVKFDDLYNGVIIYRNTPATSGVSLRGASGKHHKPERVYHG